MKVLFSPIGTADPMTALGDGPMVHIVRHYAPEKVVLFLSPDMAEFHEADNRYRRAITDCCRLLGRDLPEIEVVESKHNEVYRFDYYIEEFEGALKAIQADEEDCEILANATSGTPGMQQALVSLGAFGRLGIKLLQVVTPRGGASKRGDREDPINYEYDRLWSNNPDNLPESICRAIEVDTPNFSERLLRQEIRALVSKYDYVAASELAKDSVGLAEGTKNLIRATASRQNLAKTRPKEVFGKQKYSKMGLRYRDDKPLYEYLCTLEVRLLQGHYADFVRALTPALMETMLNMLDEFLPREEYLADKSIRTRFYYFDRAKLEKNPNLYNFIKNHCRVDFRKLPSPFLTNHALSQLFYEYYKEKPDKSKEKVLLLRKFEYGVRNILSHQISKMDRTFIEEKGGLSLDKVLQLLFELNRVEKGLYDRINEAILEELR